MAAPTSYTEKTLAAFMNSELDVIATGLGWTASSSAVGDYQHQVDNVLLTYGTTDVATIEGVDNIRKIRALSALEAWKKAAKAASGDFDWSADGASFSRSQAQKMILESMAIAEDDASGYMDTHDADGQIATLTGVKYIHDPYAYIDGDERVLP